MERHFGLAKQWRGIATRYEKLAIRLRALGRALPLRKNRHLSLRLTVEGARQKACWVSQKPTDS